MDREWLAQRLEEGVSVGAIARELGRSRSTVSNWIHKLGLQAPLAGRHAAKGGIRRERLERLIAADMTVRAIAGETGLSATSVRYWLKRYGLETTPRARREGPREAVHGVCDIHGRAPFVRRGGELVCGRCRADAVTAWRRRAKQTLIDEAGGACVLCGYERCIAALHFHHVDPAAKRFGLGSRGLARSIKTLREEAAKCVLLCANCHAEVECGVAQLPSSAAAPAADDTGR
jgi:transposase-like protein